jgi:hypothetical protein
MGHGKHGEKAELHGFKNTKCKRRGNLKVGLMNEGVVLLNLIKQGHK